MEFKFDPNKFRFAVEIGEPGKLERLDKIPRPRPNEKVAWAQNANVFDWTGKSNDGYGEIEQEGKVLKPAAPGYPCMSFKDGKMLYGDVPNAQVGVNLAILLILYGKIDIRNPAKMSTGRAHRSGVGQLANGAIYSITEENVTTEELAKIMLKKGCVIAFQNDSGDSTGMLIGTKLYDHGRAIAAALVAYRKKLIAIDFGGLMK